MSVQFTWSIEFAKYECNLLCRFFFWNFAFILVNISYMIFYVLLQSES